MRIYSPIIPRQIRFALALLIISLIHPNPTAAEAVKSLEPMVITASRLEASASDLASSIDVITRGSIDGRNAASPIDLLRHSVGVHTTQQGGRGGIATAFIRGGEPNFTAVLIDGVKVNDPTNNRGGSYDFANLGGGGIKRVEIVRGPMSAVYGSDALAGVINIVSGFEGNGTSMHSAVGTGGYRSATLDIGTGNAHVKVGTALQYVHEDHAPGNGQYEGGGAIGRASAKLSENTKLGLAFRVHNSERDGFPDESGGPRFATIRTLEHQEVEESHIRVSMDGESEGNLRLSLSGSRYQRSAISRSPGIAAGVLNAVPPSSTDTTFIRDQWTASMQAIGSGDRSFLFGAEWQREDGSSTGILDLGFPLSSDFRLERDTVSAFSELALRRGPIALQGGIRWDDPDAIEGRTTVRVGLLVKFSDNLTEIRANWGQGFKAPGFFGIAHPLVGNPDLKSESGSSFDFTVSRNLPDSNTQIALGVFRNDYRNLVDFDSEIFRIVNRSSVVTQGVEFIVRTALGERANFRAHVTFTDSEILDSDAFLRERPRWRGGAVIDWEFSETLRLVTSALVLGEAYASSIATGGVFLDGHTRIDLALSWQPQDRLTVQIGIDNLLDASYQEAVGFPANGVTARVGIKYHF